MDTLSMEIYARVVEVGDNWVRLENADTFKPISIDGIRVQSGSMSKLKCGQIVKLAIQYSPENVSIGNFGG